MAAPIYPNRFIPAPFATGGTATDVPLEKVATGRASWNEGFPEETQRPLSEGGVAPDRSDFNGIFKQMSSLLVWMQAGGLIIYSATQDYNTPSLVFYEGAIWYCRAANGPGTTVGAQTPGEAEDYWQTLQEFIAGGGGGSSSGVPVGTVISYYGTTAPEGYFICNGATFSSSQYPLLFAVLGSSRLPELRGEFIRGLAAGRAVDTNRVLGSAQGDAIRNITGTMAQGSFYAGGSGISGAFSYSSSGGAWATGYGDLRYSGRISFDASNQVPTATENRPRNVALLFCIKHD